MAVKLRLRRMGKKKQPIYKLVAADSRSPRDGKFIESVGLYNPLTDPHSVEIKEDRVNYWLDNGAQPTDTVKSLLRQKGIILKRELKRKGIAEDKIQLELEQWAKLKEAKKSTAQRKKSKSKKSGSEASSGAGKKELEEKLESQSEENLPEVSEDKKEKIEESTPEVKGAASEEDSAEKK